MDKWLKDILPDKDPYHNRGRDQMRKKDCVHLSSPNKTFTCPCNIMYMLTFKLFIVFTCLALTKLLVNTINNLNVNIYIMLQGQGKVLLGLDK
jgi:hypothetical protein